MHPRSLMAAEAWLTIGLRTPLIPEAGKLVSDARGSTRLYLHHSIGPLDSSLLGCFDLRLLQVLTSLRASTRSPLSYPHSTYAGRICLPEFCVGQSSSWGSAHREESDGLTDLAIICTTVVLVIVRMIRFGRKIHFLVPFFIPSLWFAHSCVCPCF